MIAAQYLACICWVSRLALSPVSISSGMLQMAGSALCGKSALAHPSTYSPLHPTTHHQPASQLAACISGNDVLQDLAQLTDMIADILWCS